MQRLQHEGRVEIEQPWLRDYLVKEARVRLQIADRYGSAPQMLTVQSGGSDSGKVIVRVDGVSGETDFFPVPHE